jgi:predicted ATPase
VILTGTGGVGKTRLAVQAAANLVTDFPEGVWLCELASAVDVESMLQVVAAALGYAPAPGTDLERGIATRLTVTKCPVVRPPCRPEV